MMTLMPVAAFAGSDDGVAVDTLDYAIDKDGKITFSGDGINYVYEIREVNGVPMVWGINVKDTTPNAKEGTMYAGFADEQDATQNIIVDGDVITVNGVADKTAAAQFIANNVDPTAKDTIKAYNALSTAVKAVVDATDDAYKTAADADAVNDTAVATEFSSFTCVNKFRHIYFCCYFVFLFVAQRQFYGTAFNTDRFLF